MEATYRQAYNRGWRWSEECKDLSVADDRGYTDSRAWEDGFLDYAAGRPKYHLHDCPNHDECP